MRIIHNQHVLPSRKNVILVRHGQDKEKLTSELNQHLSCQGKKETLEMGKELCLRLSPGHEVSIFHGPSLRTTETAYLLKEILSNDERRVHSHSTKDLKEFDQGIFRVDEKYRSGKEHLPLVEPGSSF